MVTSFTRICENKPDWAFLIQRRLLTLKTIYKSFYFTNAFVVLNNTDTLESNFSMQSHYHHNLFFLAFISLIMEQQDIAVDVCNLHMEKIAISTRPIWDQFLCLLGPT